MIVKELFAKLGLDLDEASFSKAALALTGLNQGLELVKKAYEALIAPVLEAIGETANMAAEAGKTAQKVGLSAEALQELRFAAKAAGQDAGDLETGLRFLSRTAFAAMNGSGEAGEGFKKLGIQFRDTHGKLRPTDELLGDVAEKFSEMEDGPKKVALSMALFGRSGNELIPFLNKGREGIGHLREEAHEFGLVLDEDAIKRSREYLKTNRELSEALEGLKLSIIAPMIHASGIKQTLTEWIVGLQKFIKTAQVIERIGLMFKGFWTVMVAIGKAVKDAWQPIHTLTLVVGVLSTAFGQAAISAAIAGAVALAPWLALSAVIAGVLLIFEDIGVFLEGGDSFIGRHAHALMHLWDPVTEAFDYAVKFWTKKFDEFVTFAVNGARRIYRAVTEGMGDAAFRSLHPEASMPIASQLVGGGGLAPAAAAAAASSVTTNQSVASPLAIGSINVTVPPGSDGSDIGNKIWQTIADYHDTKNREAAAALAP